MSKVTATATLLSASHADMRNEIESLFACVDALTLFDLPRESGTYLFTADSRHIKGAKKFTFKAWPSGAKTIVQWDKEGKGEHENSNLEYIYSSFQDFLISSFNQEQIRLSSFKPIFFYRYILIEKIESSN